MNQLNTTDEAKVGAYVLRISHGAGDGVQIALESDTVMIGWSKARELTDSTLSWDGFRQVLGAAYDDWSSARSLGSAAGHMWRFMREMTPGDYVVVPHGANFYVAEVQSEVQYVEAGVETDTAFRRKVKWLNGKTPIPRDNARSALFSRMKTLGTTAYALDIVADIRSVVEDAEAGRETGFAHQLTEKMKKAALDEIRHGPMNERKFEMLVATVLGKLGATTKITPRNQDKGDDVVATFKDIGVIVVAQVKYHTDPNYETGVEAIRQVQTGMEKWHAALGWVVTCGRFSVAAREAAEQAGRIRLVEGDDFAKMVVECGLDRIHSGLSR
jgi:predicted Mrr-cat superfamily restriction endonuclease